MLSRVSKVLLSWSTGKDSAWALHLLRRRGEVEVVGLLMTLNEAADRVAMHDVRRELVEAQAAAAGLPLYPVMLPHPCTNEVHEARMMAAISEAIGRGVTHMAFGDLFLEEVRAYPVRLLEGTGIEPMFPVWSSVQETPALARRRLGTGLKAVVTCVNPRPLGESFLDCIYDQDFLADPPAGVDSCGERGEFHTFCFAGPEFTSEVCVRVGEAVSRVGSGSQTSVEKRLSGEGAVVAVPCRPFRSFGVSGDGRSEVSP
ncbi:MAG: hypothetical protein BGO49_17300 [Planctomycetales bacterium 71-10]|nr:MAG: hypothetical protein BGO49_17300 [Planctomycetales bacterium 71-10]